MRILDLAEAIAPDCTIEFIGIRPGEKLHEVMISRDEARHTRRLGDMYVIQPEHSWWGTSALGRRHAASRRLRVHQR